MEFTEPRYSALSWNSGSGNMSVVDKVLPDMLHLVDPYWYQFAPMNPLWHSILGFVMFVVGTTGIIGNYVVISVFSTTKTLRTPANLLVCNLAFSDLLMFICLGPQMVISCHREAWTFGPLGCDFHAFAGSICGCASIWTMTMIAFDRYNVIVKGLNCKPMTTKIALLKILCIWLFGALWATAPLLGWNRYVPEGNMTACGTDYLSRTWSSRTYIIFYSIFVYWIPLLMIIYSYFFILQAVSAHEKNMREQAKKMNVASLRSSENQAQSAECKLAKVALMTIGLWFLAWTPYLLINLAGIFKAGPITPLTTIWGSVFAKCNAVCNPIVYGISHPKYKAALAVKYPRLACAGEKELPGDNASAATDVSEEKA